MNSKNDYEHICYEIQKEVSNKLEIYKRLIIDFGTTMIEDKPCYITIAFNPKEFIVHIEGKSYHGEFDKKFRNRASSMGMDMHKAKLVAIMHTFRKALQNELKSSNLA